MTIEYKAGRCIWRQRRKQRMTQEQLAALLGVTKSYISKLETGRDGPSPELVTKIADVLGFDKDFPAGSFVHDCMTDAIRIAGERVKQRWQRELP